jgi:hypothetical protein
MKEAWWLEGDGCRALQPAEMLVTTGIRQAQPCLGDIVGCAHPGERVQLRAFC